MQTVLNITRTSHLCWRDDDGVVDLFMFLHFLVRNKDGSVCRGGLSRRNLPGGESDETVVVDQAGSACSRTRTPRETRGLTAEKPAITRLVRRAGAQQPALEVDAAPRCDDDDGGSGGGGGGCCFTGLSIVSQKTLECCRPGQRAQLRFFPVELSLSRKGAKRGNRNLGAQNCAKGRV